MSQNLIDINLTADALGAIDTALATLEAQLITLVALNPDQRKQLIRMGDKSEAFCRQAVTSSAKTPACCHATSISKPSVATSPRWMRCARG